MNVFGSPDLIRSQEKAYEAERFWKKGEFANARKLFKEAAELERKVADSLGDQKSPRVKSMLYASSTALMFKAREFVLADQMAIDGLAAPGLLTAEDAVEMRLLLQRIWRESSLSESESERAGMIPLEIKLDGGQVKPGFAPAHAIRQRQELVTKMLQHTADLLGHRHAKGKSEYPFEIMEATAKAASYGIQLYLKKKEVQKTVFTNEEISVEAIVKKFLEICQVSASSPKDLKKVIPRNSERVFFLKQLKELAPDGEKVGTVSCSSPVWYVENNYVAFDSNSRAKYHEEILKEINISHGASINLIGKLKLLSFKTKPARIAVRVHKCSDPFLSDQVGDYINIKVPSELEESVKQFADHNVNVGIIYKKNRKGKVESLPTLQAIDNLNAKGSKN